MPDVFVIEYVRTPIGRFGGALSSVRADDLAALPIKALMERNLTVPPTAIEEVVMGAANQSGEDNRNVARMAALLAGLPETVPGVTVNRLCGSGLEAVVQAARAIRTGDVDLAIAGGAESMSRAPFVMPKANQAFSRATSIEDTTIGWRFVNPAMKAAHGVDSMPETAEIVAEDYQVSRADQDLFAYRSQQKAAAAQKAGVFAEEIVPVRIKTRKSENLVEADEHIRGETTLEKLASLKTPFREGGSVTAGNASGVSDGAAAILLASQDACEKYGLKPIAKITASASIGVAPRVMGIGPWPTVERMLDRSGQSMTEFDVIELNEAFASQALAVTRGLGLADDDPRVNPNGGAIALGHPLGMSGARILGTAIRHAQRTGGRKVLATMCMGVGQGLAVSAELVA